MKSRNFVGRVLIVSTSILAVTEGVMRSQSTHPPSIVIQDGLTTNKPFVVHLNNDSAVPIMFCADFGKSVQTKSGLQTAPNPFEIQKWNGQRWDTQLNGTDVDSVNNAISVDAHESKEFRLQLNASGRYRLRLIYIEGESDTKCPLPLEHVITISSKPFSLQDSAKK